MSVISLGSFNDRLFSGKTFEKNILSMILDDLQEWFLGLWNGDDYKSENKLIHDAAPHILESILAMSCDELGNFTCKFSVNGSEYTLAKLPEAITFTLSTELPPGNVKSLNFESLDQLRARCLKLYFEHCQKSDMAIDLRTLNLSFNDLCGINFENRKLSLDDINYIISLNKTIVEGKTTRFFSVSKSFEPSDSSHDEINLVGAIVVDKDGNQISDKTPLDESLGGDASTCFPDGIIRNNLGLNRYVDSVAFIAALHAAKTSNYILDFTTLKQVKDGPPKDARAEKKADNSEFAAFTIGRLVASLNYKGCVLNERSLNIIQKWGGNALNIEGAFLGEHELTYETIHERFPKMLVNDRPSLEKYLTCARQKKNNFTVNLSQFDLSGAIQRKAAFIEEDWNNGNFISTERISRGVIDNIDFRSNILNENDIEFILSNGGQLKNLVGASFRINDADKAHQLTFEEIQANWAFRMSNTTAGIQEYINYAKEHNRPFNLHLMQLDKLQKEIVNVNELKLDGCKLSEKDIELLLQCNVTIRRIEEAILSTTGKKIDYVFLLDNFKPLLIRDLEGLQRYLEYAKDNMNWWLNLSQFDLPALDLSKVKFKGFLLSYTDLQLIWANRGNVDSLEGAFLKLKDGEKAPGFPGTRTELTYASLYKFERKHLVSDIPSLLRYAAFVRSNNLEMNFSSLDPARLNNINLDSLFNESENTKFQQFFNDRDFSFLEENKLLWKNKAKGAVQEINDPGIMQNNDNSRNGAAIVAANPPVVAKIVDSPFGIKRPELISKLMVIKDQFSIPDGHEFQIQLKNLQEAQDKHLSHYEWASLSLALEKLSMEIKNGTVDMVPALVDGRAEKRQVLVGEQNFANKSKVTYYLKLIDTLETHCRFSWAEIAHDQIVERLSKIVRPNLELFSNQTVSHTVTGGYGFSIPGIARIDFTFGATHLKSVGSDDAGFVGDMTTKGGGGEISAHAGVFKMGGLTVSVNGKYSRGAYLEYNDIKSYVENKFENYVNEHWYELADLLSRENTVNGEEIAKRKSDIEEMHSVIKIAHTRYDKLKEFVTHNGTYEISGFNDLQANVRSLKQTWDAWFKIAAQHEKFVDTEEIDLGLVERTMEARPTVETKVSIVSAGAEVNASIGREFGTINLAATASGSVTKQKTEISFSRSTPLCQYFDNCDPQSYISIKKAIEEKTLSLRQKITNGNINATRNKSAMLNQFKADFNAYLNFKARVALGAGASGSIKAMHRLYFAENEEQFLEHMHYLMAWAYEKNSVNGVNALYLEKLLMAELYPYDRKRVQENAFYNQDVEILVEQTTFKIKICTNSILRMSREFDVIYTKKLHVNSLRNVEYLDIRVTSGAQLGDLGSVGDTISTWLPEHAKLGPSINIGKLLQALHIEGSSLSVYGNANLTLPENMELDPNLTFNRSGTLRLCRYRDLPWEMQYFSDTSVVGISPSFSTRIATTIGDLLMGYEYSKTTTKAINVKFIADGYSFCTMLYLHACSIGHIDTNSGLVKNEDAYWNEIRQEQVVAFKELFVKHAMQRKLHNELARLNRITTGKELQSVKQNLASALKDNDLSSCGIADTFTIKKLIAALERHDTTKKDLTTLLGSLNLNLIHFVNLWESDFKISTPGDKLNVDQFRTALNAYEQSVQRDMNDLLNFREAMDCFEALVRSYYPCWDKMKSTSPLIKNRENPIKDLKLFEVKNG